MPIPVSKMQSQVCAFIPVLLLMVVWDGNISYMVENHKQNLSGMQEILVLYARNFCYCDCNIIATNLCSKIYLQNNIWSKI